jgi:hypothetical protein
MLRTIVWTHGGSQVQLAGSWTNWEQQDMKFDQSTGFHTYQVDVAPGDAYQYKFIIDGNWCLDQDIPSVTAEDGHQNHEIVGEEAVIEEKIDVPAYDPATAKPTLRTAQIVMEAATPSHVEENHFTEWITPDDNEPTDTQDWPNKSSTTTKEAETVDAEDEEDEHWNGRSHTDLDEKINDITAPDDTMAKQNNKNKTPINWSLAGVFLVATVAIVAYISRQRSIEFSVV